MPKFKVGDIITGISTNPAHYSMTTDEATMKVSDVKGIQIQVEIISHKLQEQTIGSRFYVNPEHFIKIKSSKKKTMTNKPVYWECKDNGHNKFWASHIIKKDNVFILVRKWGRIGNNPQTMEQEFLTYSEAENTLDDLICEKERKGYKSIF